jgi:hypothetical protein
MTAHIKFPINIVDAKGSYALELLFGSKNIPIKLLIDTGSSTLVINSKLYSVVDDSNAETTQLAQCITYGKGGWAGPVIKSSITYSNGIKEYIVDDGFFSMVSNKKNDTFLGLDGIIGLAYHHLNKGFNLSEYYNVSKSKNNKTYPWKFTKKINDEGINLFKKFLNNYPEKDITPNFTAFEKDHISMNKFTLLTHRSIIYVPTTNMTQIEKQNEELNKGYFIIGDILENDKDFSRTNSIKVMHDAYYNTNLLSVRVANFKEIKAPLLEETYISSFFSNSIIDSGSSYLMLQKDIYNYVIESFKKTNPKLLSFINNFKISQLHKTPYFPENLDLKVWPNIYFTFQGLDNKVVTLCCRPDHYWQLHAFSPNQAFFTLLNQIEKWPNQSIIGLPIISSYLCTFDRSTGVNGTIKFAEKIRDS